MSTRAHQTTANRELITFRFSVTDRGSGSTSGDWFVAVEVGDGLADLAVARECAREIIAGHNRLLNSAMDPDSAGELTHVGEADTQAALAERLANTTGPNEALLAEDCFALAPSDGHDYPLERHFSGR